MTDKYIPASKLLALPRWDKYKNLDPRGEFINFADLRAIIEQHKQQPNIVAELVKALGDDAYAATFQSMAGYRTALIAKVKGVMG